MQFFIQTNNFNIHRLLTFFSLLCIILLSSMHNTHPIVIFLNGNSCVGKTSIMHEMAKIDPKFKMIDTDAVLYEIIYQRCSEMLPQEMETIAKNIKKENIFHAIVYNHILLNDQIDSCEKNDTLEALKKVVNFLGNPDQITVSANNVFIQYLREYITLKILDYVKLGYHIIIDSWFLDTNSEEKISQNVKIFKALVYCPITILIERLNIRNVKAINSDDISNTRFFSHTLTQFMDLYDLSITSSNSIDIIQLRELENACKLIQIDKQEKQQKKENIFVWPDEFNQISLNQFKQNLISKFENIDACFVNPKKPERYNLILNSGTKNVHECAQLLCLYF